MFAIKANNEPLATYVEKSNIQSGVEQTIELQFDDILSTATDISTYPLLLDYIKFNISTEIEKMDHVVDIKSLQLIYDENLVVEIDDITRINQLMVYPNPASDYIVVEGAVGDEVRIYTLDGQCIYQCTLHDAHTTINASLFAPGTYIVKSNTSSCKVIIK